MTIDNTPSWLTKAIIGALIAIGAAAVTAGAKFAWEYKLDAHRFVLDSIQRSQHTVGWEHLDTLMHEIITNQQGNGRKR